MAVYQISRIQVRRGQKSTGTGLPQLASGELAWAIDSQELFIGNGAVAEGAPAVGNTKIITEHDNFIDVIGNYQYAANNPSIQTNLNPLIPVVQSLQNVLDRTVYAENFNVAAGAGIDNALAIQRAIDQLFLKPALFLESDALTPLNTLAKPNASLRVELKFTPGWFEFSQPIYLPSYVTIKGAGIEKTVFNYTGTGQAFVFVGDTSEIGSPVILANSYNDQPKYASLKDFTLRINQASAAGITLNAVRDSVFENIEIEGVWKPIDGDVPSGCGINLVALSSIVTSQRNSFKNVTFKALPNGVISKYDIFNNTFDRCSFLESQYGAALGVGTDLLSNGQEHGPRKNVFKSCYFDSVYKNGIIVETGYGNKSRGNVFVDVGNDNAGNVNGMHSPIKFTVTGNSSLHDTFDKREPGTNLSTDTTYTYVNEIEGHVHYHNIEPAKIDIYQASTPIMAFRIPLNANTGYKIDYLYKSTVFTQVRKGQLNAIVDKVGGISQLVDEYEYAGTAGEDDKLIFSSAIENDCLVVYYKNTNISDVGTLIYTYTMLS